jgi:hypothetical protein
MQRSEQNAWRGGDTPVEREFPHRDILAGEFGIDDPHCREQRQRDRQVVMRALLGQVGGREVDGDPLRGKRQTQRGDCGANPLAAFAHRLVGQADHRDALVHPRRNLHLRFDAARLKPQIRHGLDDGDHLCPLFVPTGE